MNTLDLLRSHGITPCSDDCINSIDMLDSANEETWHSMDCPNNVQLKFYKQILTSPKVVWGAG